MITPNGRCTARVEIHGFTYANPFIVLPECSVDLIVGMDSLLTHGPIIDLEKSKISFSTNGTIASHVQDERDKALHIVDDDVTLPACTIVLVNVKRDAIQHCAAIAAGIIQMLMDKVISLATGLVRLQDGSMPVLLTNFANVRRHITEGPAIGFI